MHLREAILLPAFLLTATSAARADWQTPGDRSPHPAEESGLLSPDGFFGIEAGYAIQRGATYANGARADLAGAFTHDTGGVALQGGMDFGFGRLGVSTGYYADHVPWGLTLAGAVLGSAMLHGNVMGNGDGLYYELRTELSELPMTVFYEQRITLPADLGEIRFGPVVGGTVNLLSAHYAQGSHADADFAFTYGARVAFDAKIDKHTRLRVAYEYDRSTPTGYDLGFRLRLGERESHRITVGVVMVW